MGLKSLFAKVSLMLALWLYKYTDPHAPAGFLVGDPSFTLQPVQVVVFDDRVVYKFGDEKNRKYTEMKFPYILPVRSILK